MEKKVMALIAVAVVVGAGIGIGIGAVVFNKDTNETYWFYLDDGRNTASVTGWYSAKGVNQCEALKVAMKEKNIELKTSIGTYGFSIDSIADLKMEQKGADWYYWTQFTWSGENYTMNNKAFDFYKGMHVFCLAYGKNISAAPAAASAGGPF